ncbi:hypothetical protein N7539_007248 [Penicillium diatomitis]|uniref:CRAL-TRIO domain-containing protein n=1 Tax=Penicillium diatomitis TaxID=2819901 RepID=A0A9W9WUV0_9EURO|nr:uncharacterized protein N7539_007248 [Penicillium diatomitis]KAJ5477104.1 hypothetical protein N7539_007248 [Penicillium diatomitis]
MTTPATAPGYVGNLDSTQEKRLQELWITLMQTWDREISALDCDRPSETSPKVNGKQGRRMFSLSKSPAQPTETELAAIPPNLLSTLESLGAGPGELKAVGSLLMKVPGDKLRSAFLTLLRQDHPDAFLLRFLRAERWNVPKAWIKFVGSLYWRAFEYKVDEQVLSRGEEYNLLKSQEEANTSSKRDGEGFMHQLRIGKGYLHGCDRAGRPICFVRVRTHAADPQMQKGLFDYIMQGIETARFLQVPPVESMDYSLKAILFDLTGFGLSNWDFPPVRFIIETFQNYYPESLGAMIFYNAPWIFSGFWKIISGILDPVVASKVHFISGPKELEKLVPRSQILKEFGGDEDWEFKYIEPLPNENERLKDTVTRDLLLSERRQLGDELFCLTNQWISQSDVKTTLERRDEVISGLRVNYWKLDPYVRARNYLDRTSVIKEDGTIDFYPHRISGSVDEKSSGAKESVEEQLTAATIV